MTMLNNNTSYVVEHNVKNGTECSIYEELCVPETLHDTSEDLFNEEEDILTQVTRYDASPSPVFDCNGNDELMNFADGFDICRSDNQNDNDAFKNEVMFSNDLCREPDRQNNVNKRKANENEYTSESIPSQPLSNSTELNQILVSCFDSIVHDKNLNRNHKNDAKKAKMEIAEALVLSEPYESNTEQKENEVKFQDRLGQKRNSEVLFQDVDEDALCEVVDVLTETYSQEESLLLCKEFMHNAGKRFSTEKINSSLELDMKTKGEIPISGNPEDHSSTCRDSSTANGEAIFLNSGSIAKEKGIFSDFNDTAADASYERVSVIDLPIRTVSADSVEESTVMLPSTKEDECKRLFTQQIPILEQSVGKDRLSLFAGNRDIDVSKCTYENLGAISKSIDDFELPDFRSASNRAIYAKRELLAKAKQFLIGPEDPPASDFSAVDCNSSSLTSENENVSGTDFQRSSSIPCGFSTASGKSIHVKPELLSKVKQFFMDVREGNPLNVLASDFSATDFNNSACLVENENSSTRKKAENSSRSTGVPCGFSTASGKPVHIKHESLAKAERLFANPVEDTPIDFFTVNFDDLGEKENPFAGGKSEKSSQCIMSCDFSTASGNPVQLKQESLAKAKRLFADPEETNPLKVLTNDFYEGNCSNSSALLENQNSFTVTNSSDFQHFDIPCGFSTASGKPVHVKHESLAKAERLFTDPEDPLKALTNKFSAVSSSNPACTLKDKNFFPLMKYKSDVQPCNIPCGFSTASGKSIQIKQEAIMKAKQLYSDFENSTFESALPGSLFAVNNITSALSEVEVDSFDQRKSDSYIVDSCKPSRSSESDKTQEMKTICDAMLSEKTQCHARNPLQQISTNNLLQEINETNEAFVKDEYRSTSFYIEGETSSPSFLNDRDLASFCPSFLDVDPFATSTPKSQRHTKAAYSSRRFPKPDIKNTFSNRDSNVEELRGKEESMCHSITISEDLPSNSCRIIDCIEAANEQEELIKNKSRIKAIPGSYFRMKQEKPRIELRDIGNPRVYTAKELLCYGVKPEVMRVNAQNAAEFLFVGSSPYGECANTKNNSSINVGDDAILVVNTDGNVRFKEICRAFLASPGVDPLLVSEDWVRNHYRWIVWKLAAMERSFPQYFANRSLTVHHVMLQLKYRYDREIDRCQRSCLKRILESDDAATKMMILCVASITEVPDSIAEYELELTDGWYSVMAVVDFEMNKFIKKEMVVVGTKLVICNGELIGHNGGCDPLAVPDRVRLKVATNSVRRARWYAKLGYCRSFKQILSTIRTVLPDGGIITSLRAIVAQIYPTFYLEKCNDGKSVIHSEKAEAKVAAEFEKRCSNILEKVHSQVRCELLSDMLQDGNCYQELNSKPSDGLGSSTYDVKDVEDFSFGVGKINDEYRELVLKKLPDECKYPRNVRRLVKVRLVDATEDGIKLTSCILTIWHPSENILSLIVEGSLCTFRNIFANGIRNRELQLSTSRQTVYEVISKHVLSELSRKVSRWDDFWNDYFIPPFGEVDVVGIVANETHICDRNASTIYVADESQNIFALYPRCKVNEADYSDILTPGCILACANLQWNRSYVFNSIPKLFIAEFSLITRNPRQKHLQHAIEVMRKQLNDTDMRQFVLECQKKLSSVVASDACIPSVNKSDRINHLNNVSVVENTTRTKTIQHKLSIAAASPVSSNVHSRLQKLEAYGQPPPLPPIILNDQRRKSCITLKKNRG